MYGRPGARAVVVIEETRGGFARCPWQLSQQTVPCYRCFRVLCLCSHNDCSEFPDLFVEHGPESIINHMFMGDPARCVLFVQG
jgi:hypothetical protein